MFKEIISNKTDDGNRRYWENFMRRYKRSEK